MTKSVPEQQPVIVSHQRVSKNSFNCVIVIENSYQLSSVINHKHVYNYKVKAFTSTSD